MKIKCVLMFLALMFPVLLFAGIINPVDSFKVGLIVPLGDKIVKWEVDLNGDGKEDVFLSLKSDFESAFKNGESPAWSVFIASPTGGSYWKPEGIESTPGAVSMILPDIDPDACYVGEVTQLGKRGVVTMRIKNPRSGESIATIYAYTVDENHLKYTELAQYEVGQPNSVFDQYLKDRVRTQVQLQSIAP